MYSTSTLFTPFNINTIHRLHGLHFHLDPPVSRFLEICFYSFHFPDEFYFRFYPSRLKYHHHSAVGFEKSLQELELVRGMLPEKMNIAPENNIEIIRGIRNAPYIAPMQRHFIAEAMRSITPGCYLIHQLG